MVSYGGVPTDKAHGVRWEMSKTLTRAMDFGPSQLTSHLLATIQFRMPTSPYLWSLCTLKLKNQILSK